MSQLVLLYLLKANVVLALFAAAYYGLLRQLTFFELNRAYLVLALLFAAAYPALPVPGLLPAASLPAQVPVGWAIATAPAAAVASLPVAAGPDCWAVALGVYAVGSGLLLARLLGQLLALARLRRAAAPATTAGGVAYRQLPAPGDPFSFGRTIYLHPGQHSVAELAVIIAHEQAHVRQAHTLDVLLAHVGTALFWMNPASWLLRRALLDNLEYLADAATLRTGLDRRAYQYCLLQLSRGPAGPALALPFTFFTLKNRVAMMNAPLSSTSQRVRYLLAGPLLAVAALGYAAAHTHRAGAASQPVSFAASQRPALPATGAAHAATPPASAGPAPASQPAGSAQPSVQPARPDRPVQAGPVPLYYVDGKAVAEAAWKALNKNDIATVTVLKGEQARLFAGELGATGVVIITTTANQNSPLVQEINQRVARIVATPGLQANPAAPAGQPLPADAHYYLNGQPTTVAAVGQLKPDDIASIDVVKNQLAKPHQSGLTSGQEDPKIFVITKGPVDVPAVLSAPPKPDLDSDYTSHAVGIYYLLPKTLAYITSHYPDSRLGGVSELTHKATGAVKYQVQLITGKRPFYVYFTPIGEFLSE